MLSKWIFQLVILSVGLIGLGGCGLNIGEPSAQPAVAEVKTAQCLTQSIVDLKIYFAGDATDAQVETSILCLQNVFVAFKENIRGEKKDTYTAREIATFVELNFLKVGEAKFTKEFLNQLMLFKVALFGGTEKVIHKNEINLIVSFLARFKPEFVKLNSHMKIISKNWFGKLLILEDSVKEKQFLAAKSQFSEFIRKLSLEFKAGGRAYKIDDLLNFVTEILRFANSNESTIEKIKKTVPFLKKFKFHLIGGEDSLQGNDWEKMGLTLNEAYFQTLRIEYFLKRLDPHQVEAKWTIYEKIATDLTTLIENLLKTKEKQLLTNEEIYDLLQPLNEFLPELGLSKDLLAEFGDFKIIILGHSDVGRNGWSQGDFEILNKKIPVLFKNLAVLLETIDYISLEKSEKFRKNVNYFEFLQAEVKVLSAVSNLSSLIEGTYDLESGKLFINHLAQGPFKKYFKLPTNFESLFKVALAGKLALTGEAGSSLSRDGIKLLLNVGAHSYLNYLEFDLFARPFDSSSVGFVLAMEKLWPKIKSTILIELNLKPENAIKSSELTELVRVLQSEKFLLTKISGASLESFFKALSTHLLNRPEDRLNLIFRKGFDSVSFEQLSAELDIWLGVQKHIAQIFATTPEWAKNEILPEIDKRLKLEMDSAVKNGLADLRTVLDQNIAMTFSSQGFLNILTKPGGLYHQADLNKSNLARAISRLLIRAYAGDLDRVSKMIGVLKPEIQICYDQLKPLAVDLDIVQPENTTFVSSRFLESNLFLSVSDGDQFANFLELHHLVLHLLSGVERAAEIRKDLIRDCLPPATNSVTQSTEVLQDCTLDKYISNESAFLGLPQFLSMRSQFGVAEIREYYMNLLKAAGHVPNDKKTVLLSDADLFPHVVQYIEMVFSRHDLNRDNFLQKDEALAAFPVFKELLKDLVKSYKQIKEEDLPGVFVYILKNGRPPKKTSIGELLKFVVFIKDKDQKDWDINSSRLDLGKIFDYIADATKATPLEPTKPISSDGSVAVTQ